MSEKRLSKANSKIEQKIKEQYGITKKEVYTYILSLTSYSLNSANSTNASGL